MSQDGMLQPRVTGPLSRFIAGSPDALIPEETRDLAKRHILDTLAAIVACRDLEPSVLARKFALEQSGDARRNAATILGTTDRAALIDAVFASAMAGHGAEINDFIPSSFVQPGPSIVSTTLALAELRGGSGDDVVRAVVTGYELAGRIPRALGIDNLRRFNIANHGIGPVFGVAAAAASMMRLPEDRIGDLLSYCAQQAAGCYQWLLDVEHIEKSFVFAGLGARAGLQAALFVEAGFRGVRNALDHPSGWMGSATFTGPGSDGDRAYLVDDLGVRSELPLTAYKRFPVGGPTQPAVQGLLELLPQIQVDDVEVIRIEMPGRWEAFRDAEMPALNLRYLTSIILLDGELDFVAAQSLERMHGDAAVRALMERVEVVHDPKQEHGSGEPRRESARVIIQHKSRERLELFVPYVVGFPSHPMSRADVESKALGLLTPQLGAERADAVVARVRDLESMARGADLIQLIAP
ncbi:MAG: MmgE/PrpD family protein [Phenylobacterium sp.]|nr:MmgE/PrpD family protein [Phenylobacterium sp.]